MENKKVMSLTKETQNRLQSYWNIKIHQNNKGDNIIKFIHLVCLYIQSTSTQRFSKYNKKNLFLLLTPCYNFKTNLLNFFTSLNIHDHDNVIWYNVSYFYYCNIK